MPSSVKTTRKVQTSAEFKREVVDPDYKDYKQNPSDLRLCYHLALGLFHLRDWTFKQYSGTPNWPHKTPNDYQIFLEQQCSSFGYIRDLANAVKHAELDQPSTQMVGLANTELSGPAFQPGAFQGNAFQVQTVIISEIGPKQFVAFEPAADAVMAMWNHLFSNKGWV